MLCIHYAWHVLHALCISCIMHYVHYTLYALCITCIMHCMHYASYVCIACIRYNHTHHVGTTQAYYCQQSTFETRCGPTDRPTDRPTNRPTDRPTVWPTDQLILWLIELLSQLKKVINILHLKNYKLVVHDVMKYAVYQ